MIGKTFGRLSVVGYGAPSWLKCSCQCGKSVNVRRSNLECGHVRSCGCLQRDHRKNIGSKRYVHGHDGTLMHKAWIMMHQRCKNPKNQAFKHYGGRGISVCVRWNSYEKFLEDMGERPNGMSLERKNNDGNYEPDNCKWATHAEQAKNRRFPPTVLLDGNPQTLASAARELGITHRQLRYRLLVGTAPENVAWFDG